MKITLTFPIRGLALFLSLSSAFAAEDELAHWAFDRLNEQGHIADLISGADLEPQGSVAFEPGLYGNAARLTSGQPFFRIGHQPQLDLVDDFTIRCTVRPDAVRGYRLIVWKGDRSVKPEEVNYYLGIRDGKFEFKTKDAEGQWHIYTAEQQCEPYHWYEVDLYFTRGMATFSINGTSPKVTTSSRAPLQALRPCRGPIEVGEGQGPKVSQRVFQFSGLMDDLSFFNGRHLREGSTLKQAHAERVAGFEERHRRHIAEQQSAEEQRRRQREERHRRFFAEEAEGAPLVVRVLPASRRINHHDDFLNEVIPLSRTIRLTAARNERESVQLILTSPLGQAAKKVMVIPGDLHGDGGTLIPANLVSGGWVKSVRTEQQQLPVEFAGEIPDIITEELAGINIAAGDFMPVLLRWHIPAEIRPGVYRGSVTVRCDDWESTVPVELTVRSFELPKRNSLPVIFCFFESYYRQWYGIETLTNAQRLAIYEFLLSFRVPPTNIYERELYPPLPLVQQLKDRLDFITLGSWGGADSTPAAAAKRVEQFRERIAAMKELGMEDAIYFYGVDEVSGNFAERLGPAQEAHRYLSKNFPDLRTVQTSYPSPEIESLFNVWVPLIDHFEIPAHRAKLETLRKRGDRIWWYLTEGPSAPFLNIFLDYPVFNARILLSLTYHYNVEGVLYWSINREWVTNDAIRSEWPDAEWKPYIYHGSTGQRMYVHGMGNLVYPGPEGRLLPSLRLENLRDGIEDYEYLMLLRKAMERTTSPEKRAAAQALLKLPEAVGTAINKYSSDPAHLLDYREKVAAMIELLQSE